MQYNSAMRYMHIQKRSTTQDTVTTAQQHNIQISLHIVQFLHKKQKKTLSFENKNCVKLCFFRFLFEGRDKDSLLKNRCMACQ